MSYNKDRYDPSFTNDPTIAAIAIALNNEVNSIKDGPTGPAGPLGPVGPQGIQGLKGERGFVGSQGLTGATGVKGEKGIQGAIGPAGGPVGPTGAVGQKGEKGQKGMTGQIGATGSQGIQGQQGIQGLQGQKGEVGEKGMKGSKGEIGDKGQKGEIGFTGQKGEKGEIGQKGDRGQKGDLGLGATGAKGQKGQKGEASTVAGPIGLAGATGSTGLKGNKGDRFSIDFVVNSVAALGNLFPVLGNFAIINSSVNDPDNSKLYVYDGTNWQYQTDMSGIQGNTGATGATGAQGIQGVTGATGLKGEKGDNSFNQQLNTTNNVEFSKLTVDNIILDEKIYKKESLAVEDGDSLVIAAGSTIAGTASDRKGGNLVLQGGRGKGNASGGNIRFDITQAEGNPANGQVMNPYETAMIITSEKKVGIGISNPTESLEINGKLKTGVLTFPNTDGNSNQILKTDGAGNISWGDYDSTLSDLSDVVKKGTGASHSYYLGTNNLHTQAQGLRNYSFGNESLKSIDAGSQNIGIGSQAGMNITNGSDNITIGYMSGNKITTAISNTVLGSQGGVNTTGSYNTLIGNEAGNLSTETNTQKNVYIGYRAGKSNTGSSNVFIGNEAGNTASFNGVSNKLIISNSSSTTPLIEGDFSNETIKLSGNITINKGNNTITFPSSRGSNGQILKTNGSGVLSWVDESGIHTFGISNTNTVKIDDASVSSGDYAKFTANGLQGKSVSELKTELNITKGDIGLSNVENTAISTWSGSSNLTTIGTLTSLDIDNINIDGNDLTSTNTNGDINITPNGNGHIVLDGIKWVTSDGTAGQILVTDGSGHLSWTTNSGGGGGASSLNDLSDVSVVSNVITFGSSDTTGILPADDNGVDIGSTAKSFKDAHIQGIIYASKINNGTTLTLPTSDGTNGQVLKTDGSGNLSWTANSGSGATSLNELTDVSVSSNQITFGSVDTTGILPADDNGVDLGSSAKSFKDAHIQGVVYASTLNNGVSLTLPTSDGTNGQVLKTDGSGNLSWSTNSGGSTITGAATTIDTEDLTVSRALISNASGKVAVSAVTDTELGYLDGVTSAIQTQIDSKQGTLTFNAPSSNNSNPSTSAQIKSALDGKQDTLTFNAPSSNNANPSTSAQIKTALDGKQDTITGAATTIDTEDLTVSRALISNASGKVAVSAVTDTELGYLDGVTSAIQTQIDGKQVTITGAATTIDTENLTASRALISNASGKVAVSAVTDTELGYLDGVTSAIQTQIDSKQGTLTFNAPSSNNANPSTSAQIKSALDGKQDTLTFNAPSSNNSNPSTSAQIKTALDGKQDTITGAATTIDTEDLTVSRALISNASGKVAVSAVTDTELSYLDGVTSSIQSQIDSKQAILSFNAPSSNNTNPSTSAQIKAALDTKASLTSPEFSGFVGFKNGNTSGGLIALHENSDNGTNYVGLKAPETINSNVTFTLPSSDGTSGQVLSTNASGVLSWVNNSGGGGGASSLNDLSDVTVASNTIVFGSADTIGILPADDNGVDLGSTTNSFKNAHIQGVIYTSTLNNGASLTLPTSDGTSGQVLKTDGSGNLGWVSNSATLTGAGSTIDTEDLTASRALISNASGKVAVSAVTDTELGYLDGVTSAIQTQIDSKQASLTFGIANTNTVKIDHASVADDDYARFTSTGLEGRSVSEMKTDLSLNNVENTALSTWTGSSNVTTVGTLTSLQVDYININGGSITSTNTNGDITVTPNGTGKIVLDGLSWPTTDGTANYVLKTDGSGNLSWVANGSGGGASSLNDLSDVTVSSNVITFGSADTTGILPADDNGVDLGSTTKSFKDAHIQGIVYASTLNNGASLTLPTADGTSGQVLKTDGSGNLGWVSNSATLTGAGSTIDTEDLTVSRALISNASGKVAVSAVTDTELSYLDGVTSAIQTQIDSKQASLTFGIANTNSVKVDHASVADDDYARFTANGLEGRSFTEVKTDLSLDNVENTALSTWTGTSNITTIGTLTSLDVDNLKLDGNAITSTDTNGNITVTPNGTGKIVLDGLSWPTSDGTANYVLKTDGSGNLSWVANGSGGGASSLNDLSDVSVASNVITFGSADTTGILPADDNGVDLGSTAKSFKDAHIQGIVYASTLNNGASLTLPTGDGTNGQVLKTDGSGNLGWVSNSATLSGAGSTIDTEDLTASRALISNASGKVAVSAVTDTELGYLDGVTSAIQTQIDSKQASLTFGIANTNAVKIDHASVADNDYAKFTANGLEGRSFTEVKTDLSLNNVENTALSTWTGTSNITTVGTLTGLTVNGDVTISDGTNDLDIASHDGTNGLKLGGTLVTTSAAELNILDGSATTQASVTLADGDGVVISDGDVMKQCLVSDFKTYVADLTLTTAAQTNITSVGTLTSLDVDNIKVDGNAITSTDTNGNITITPDGTGKIVLDGLSWPTADGTANYVLKTDGSGNLSWVANGSGGGASSLNDLSDVTVASNVITFGSADTTGILPADDNGVDLGSTAKSFKDAHIQGVIYASTLNNGTSLTLPTTDGTNGQVLSTNGSGALSWTTATASALAADNLTEGDATIGINTTSGSINIGTNTTASNNVNIGTGAVARTVTIGNNTGASGVNVTAGTGNINLVSNTITMSGHLIPSTNDSFDIGSATNKIRDIYVSSNSLWIGDDHKIQISNGKMKFRKRKNNIVPASISSAGGNEAAALAYASKGSLSAMTLEDWAAYGNTLNVAGRGIGNVRLQDIFADNAADYADDFESGKEYGIGDTNALRVDGASTAGDFAKFTANGIVSKTTAEVKSDLSLNNVENTAISTWAGSSNLTTIGTLTALQVDNIKVDGNAITSTDTNGNITVTPNGTGKIVLDGLSWPTADGSSDQVLKTDGSGNLSWVSNSATLSGAGSTIDTENLTASRALISNDNGKVAVSAVTDTELGYLDGVTSAIQTQLDSKIGSTNPTISGTISVDSISERSSGHGVKVDSVLIKDNTVTGHTITATNYNLGSRNVISASAQGSFTDIELKHNGTVRGLMYGETGNMELSGTLSIDTINEKTSASGVTIDNVLLKDNTVTGHTITATNFNLGNRNIVSASAQGSFSDLELKSNGTTGILAYGQTGNMELIGTLKVDTINENTTNGNISIAASGSGKIIIDGLSWPTADGTSGQVLKTDGSGNLSWVSNSATLTGAGSTIDTEDLTVSRALISNASGKVAVSAVTDTELSYLDGVTSAIQTQIDSKQASLTFGISNTNAVKIDNASVADDDYARFTANGLEGRSYTEVKTDLSLNNVENTAISTWTGSGNIVNIGSINLEKLDQVNYTVISVTKTALHPYYNSGSSKGYKINGQEAAILMFVPGKTYRFDMSDNSNLTHPLRFYLDVDKNTQYTTNVTESGTAGNANAYVEIVITDSTPTKLFYQCGNHPKMGNYGLVKGYANLGTLTSLDVDNIKVDGNAITSTDTNGNITITPDGSGKIVLDGLSWPTVDGTANYVLKTDGSGNLSWVANGSGGGASSLNDLSDVSVASNVITFGSADTTGILPADDNGVDLGSTTKSFKDAHIQGVIYASTLNNGASLTLPTADGTSGQVLKTDGSGNLGWVSNSATLTGAGSTIDTEDLTASRALISNASGKVAVSDVTNTELSYLDGVTSAIQTQIDSKQASLTFGIANTNAVRIDHASVEDNDYAKFTANGLEGRSFAEVKTDLSLNNVENTAISTWTGSSNITSVGTLTALQVDNIKVDGNAITSTDSNGNITVTPNGTGKIVLDGLSWPTADGSSDQVLKTDGSGNLAWVSNSATLTGAGSTIDTENLTVSRALISNASGKVAVSAVTDTELGYLDGVTSAIQTQIDSKQASLTFGISNTNALRVDGASVADNDYAKFTANGLEGRSFAEVKTDLSLNNVENTAISTWSGSSNVTTVGTLTTLQVDNINVNGNAITSTDTNGNITVTPNGTGKIVLDGLSWPTADGSSDQVLKTDGSGNLSWVTNSTTLTGAASTIDTEDLTVSRALISNASGKVAVSAVTDTELSYLDGVTSAIQTQIDSKQASLTFGIANTNSVKIDDTSVADNDYARFTANGVEGRTVTEVKTDLSLNNVENTAISTWTGSSNITTVGTLTSLDIDNLKLDGNAITSTDTNGNINITPNGSGNIVLDGVSWVTSDGSAGQVLVTNGSGTLSWSNLPTPTYGIGNTNAVRIDHASVADNDFAKFTANGLEGRSAAEVKTDLDVNSYKIFSVSTSGNNYRWNNSSTNNEDVILVRGLTYYIDLSVSGHPFRIQESGNNTSGTLYTSGITHSDGSTGSSAHNKTSGRLTFTVPYDAPNTLYYQCQYHTNMYGKFVIANSTGNCLATAPTTSTSSGKPGEMAYGQSGGQFYLYICIADNSWKKVQLSDI